MLLCERARLAAAGLLLGPVAAGALDAAELGAAPVERGLGLTDRVPRRLVGRVELRLDDREVDDRRDGQGHAQADQVQERIAGDEEHGLPFVALTRRRRRAFRRSTVGRRFDYGPAAD